MARMRKPGPSASEYVAKFLIVLPNTDPLVPEAGAGACPPEDVGGRHGYADFLQIIRDPRHPEHRSTLKWVGGSFDPTVFHPESIVFDDPAKRWQTAFVDQE